MLIQCDASVRFKLPQILSLTSMLVR